MEIASGAVESSAAASAEETAASVQKQTLKVQCVCVCPQRNTAPHLRKLMGLKYNGYCVGLGLRAPPHCCYWDVTVPIQIFNCAFRSV